VEADVKVQVLDQGYVELVETWGSEERIIEAARMSTNKGFVDWDKDAKLLHYLYKHEHMTPFEMCGAIFEVKAPIFVFREWHRHRTQSYNEMSARYVPLPDENYIPEATDTHDRAMGAFYTTNRQASAVSGKMPEFEKIKEWRTRLANAYYAAQEAYEYGLSVGVPKELARLSTPVGRYSRMRASANLRNWLQFLELRTAPGAQLEIQHYALAVQSLLTEHFPRTLAEFMFRGQP
jgi:thymidylate synthase (FAD)